jgi:hypothetical protein
MAAHDLWRIDAKHATVCPRCRGYIDKGTWIVKDENYSKWVHAVCPGMDTRENEPEEDLRGTNTVLRVGANGVVTAEETKVTVERGKSR